MAVVVYTGPTLLVGGYKVDADFKSLAVNLSSALLDSTTFGNTAVARMGGLFDTSIEAHGLVNLGSCQSESILFTNLGVGNTVVSAFPTAITVGSTVGGSGYGIQTVQGKYTVGGQVGPILPITISAQGAGGTRCPRAWVLHNALVTALTTAVSLTTNGTAYQYAANTTCESLFGGFHMTAASTGVNAFALTAVIQSATSSGFAAATARGSFTAQSCKAAQWLTPVASSSLSTDHTYWRVQYTFTGTCGSTISANALTWMSIGPQFPY